MNCWNANLALDKRFAFIDAMTSVIGLAITVIELAVVATCTNLGPNGLEIVVGITAVTSIFFESTGALLTQLFGFSRTLLFSVAMKALAHIAMLCAVILTVTQGATLCSWVLLVVEATIDSIATGGIIASYRPSYGFWYQSQSGKSIDLMKTFAHCKTLRAFGPIMVWATTFILVKVFAKPTSEIWVPTILLLTAITLRGTQFMLYNQDLSLVFNLEQQTLIAKKIKSSVVENIKLFTFKVTSGLKLVFKNHYQYLLYYIYGNLIFLVVACYLLGEISRMFLHQGSNLSLMIMLGVLVGLLVHLFSSFIGAKYYPTLSNWVQLRLFCAVAMTISIVCSVVLACGNSFFSVLALIVIALMFYLIGIGIVRHISTSFMRISQINTQSIFFSVAEILSSSLLLIVMLALTVFDNRSMGICLMVMLTSFVGIKFFWSGRQLDNSHISESKK